MGTKVSVKTRPKRVVSAHYRDTYLYLSFAVCENVSQRFQVLNPSREQQQTPQTGESCESEVPLGCEPIYAESLLDMRRQVTITAMLYK